MSTEIMIRELETVRSINLNVSVEQLVRMGIPIEGFLFLYFVHSESYKEYKTYVADISSFEENLIEKLLEYGYIRRIKGSKGFHAKDFVILDLFMDLLSSSSNPDGWIDDWYDLWPKGVKSGGSYVRTSKDGCLRKMKRFLIKHPQYDKFDIMKATRNYISSFALNNYAYIKLAPYFIEKDGVSILAGELEALSQDNNVINVTGGGFGEDEI